MTKDIEAIRTTLEPLLKAIGHPDLGLDWTLPWKVKPCDGKPIIASNRGGNLFRGYIATWQEADLIVGVVNALPDILNTLTNPTSDIAPVDTDDRMVAVASRNLKTFIKAAQFKCNADRDAALACVEVLDDRISAAQGRDRWAGVIELVEQITAEEGASVTFVCANPDFNGLPNEAVTVMQGEDWQEVTYRGDTLAACLQQAIEQKGAGQ